jgi:prepilin peptidase CpaA
VSGSFLFSGEVPALGALLLSGFGLAAACFSDLKERRIPNRLNVALAIGLMALHINGAGLSGLLDAALAFALCFGCGVLLYALGALGAGDVKLLGALSLALDSTLAWQLLARTALAGGILGITRLIADGNFRHALFGLLSSARRAQAERSSVPYALAIAAGWFWLFAAGMNWTQ